MSIAVGDKSSQEDFEATLREYLAARGAWASRVPDARGIREGLDVATLDRVREWLHLRDESLERVLAVSARTLQRRRAGDHRLTAAESDRLWRVLHVVHRAVEAFGDEEAARAWLMTPNALLGGEAPLERLDTEPGLRQVEDMFTVIDETSAA